MGDIPERCLANRVTIIRETTAFMKTLLKAVAPRKVVYLLGNHDHTLWRDLLKKEGKKWEVTGPDKPVVLDPTRNQAHEELAKIFFNYPEGSLCRPAPGSGDPAQLPVDFRVGNYFYHTKLGERSYLFSHGQHWRRDVTEDEWMTLFSWISPWALGHPLIPPKEPFAAKNMKDLERRTYGFIDSLWSNDNDEDMSQKAFEWFLLSNLSSLRGQRPGPKKHTFFRHNGAKLIRVEGDTGRKVPDFRKDGNWDGSTQRLLKFVKKTFRHSPGLTRLLSPELTLLYGDTHDSGYNTLPHILKGKSAMRVYNTGAWVTHRAEHEPAGFFFGVKDDEEWMVEVAHDTDSLQQAGRDAQHLWDSITDRERAILSQFLV